MTPKLADALGRFALAHPTRPLSEVTVREFADWYEGTQCEQVKSFPHPVLDWYMGVPTDAKPCEHGAVNHMTGACFLCGVAVHAPIPAYDRCPHCHATNGEHKTHPRFKCMGGRLSYDEAARRNAVYPAPKASCSVCGAASGTCYCD